MSIINVLKSTLVVAFGAVVGYSSVKFFSEPSENNRGLASVTYSKLASEQFAKTQFEIKIKNEDLALKASDVSTIYVSMEAYRDIPNGLFYTWNLPDTVSVVEGSLSGDLETFTAHQKKEFRLKVRNYSKEVRSFISFSVKGAVNNIAITQDALISSRPEDSFEYVVQQHEVERTAKNKNLRKLGKPEVKSPIDINKVSF